VPFVEKNVGVDRQAASEMVRVSGQQGVPVITIDNEVVVGFDRPRIMQLLDKSRPKLGASVADAATQARRQPGLPSSGAYVGAVRTGTAADQAGLRTGDVITALGGEPVHDATQLHRRLREMPKGREVSMTYVRDGQEHNTMVRL
jgi:S1-C subfamily serine protease